MDRNELPPIISGGLYKQGKYGLLLVESFARKNGLAILWAYLYNLSLINYDLAEVLFSSNLGKVDIGQGCSSTTMIATDSQISLMASTMNLKIQDVLENGLSRTGEILLLKYSPPYSLSTEVITVPEHMMISTSSNEWKVFLSKPVYEEMRTLSKSKFPNETGGVLLGSVFPYPKIIVITKLLFAPPDSIEKQNKFILGVSGLKEKIRKTESATNGKVTYLGTWHSHPLGGGPSFIDINTYRRLLETRNYEPTVCLIISQEDIVVIENEGPDRPGVCHGKAK
jgi:integrative and conjugative element protein (TIGR02256 family)